MVIVLKTSVYWIVKYAILKNQVGVIVDSPKENNKSSKHCVEDDVKICTMCDSTNLKIKGESITRNDCNAILCH